MKRKGEPKKTPPHYAGRLSEKFWKRINRLPESERQRLYLAGCMLQEMEGIVVRTLDYAEWEVKHG